MHTPSVRAVFIALLTCLLHSSLTGQILNIDKNKLEPEESDTAGYFVLDINASTSMYNRSAGVDDPVNLFGYNLGGDAGYIGKKHSYMLINKYDFLRINDDVFLNTGYSHFRVIFNRENKLSVENFAQYQYDNFRGLHPRLLAGGGIRLDLIDKDNFALRVGTGAMFEHEEWQRPYEEGSVVMNLIKNSNYVIARWQIKKNIKLNGIAYYQTGYDQTINALRNRVSGEVNLNINLTEQLRFITSFNANYEDKPVVAVTPFIYSLTNGISFTL